MRRFTAAFAVALISLLLPATAAIADDHVVPGEGTVVGVTPAVNERTPLYNLELTFDLVDVTCPAFVHYRMGSATLAAPVDQCTDPDTNQPVAGGTFLDTATATTMRPMFGEGLGVINPRGFRCDDGDSDESWTPGCRVSVYVGSTADINPSNLRLLGGGSPVEVPIPPRPVWVGVGDGYTGQVVQHSDWCYGDEAVMEAAAAARGYYFVTQDPGPSSVGPNAWENPYIECLAFAPEEVEGEGDILDIFEFGMDRTGQSWIRKVVQTFNQEYEVDGANIPCVEPSNTHLDELCWEVVPEVVAEHTVTAAQLQDGVADPTDQLGQLEAILTSADHYGSWNWLGVSAGLLDAGIPEAIQAMYPGVVADDVSGYVYEDLDTGGYVPWRPDTGAGDACPTFDPLPASAAASIEAGITNVIAKAQAWSPGLKSIVVRYPWLTEQTSTATGLPNPCAVDGDSDGMPDNRETIAAVNAAIDAALGNFQASDDVWSLNLAAEMNLQEGFSDEPTDSVPDRRSYLQLTRPYGYPYPSDYGANAMGETAYSSIEESGLQPPTIEGTLVQWDGNPSSPSTPESPSWKTESSSGTWYWAPDLYVEWVWDAPEGFASLEPAERVALLRGQNRTYTGAIRDQAGGSASATVSYSWDPDPPVITERPVGGTKGTGSWWKQAPTSVAWDVVDDWTGYTTQFPPSGATSATLPAKVPSGIGAGVRVDSDVAFDVAGNSTSKTIHLDIDPFAPSVTGVSSTDAGWSNADHGWVTWTRTDLHSGLADTGTIGTDTVTTYAPAGSDGRTREGSHMLQHTVSDNAGWTASASATVRIDRTPPSIDVLGSWPTQPLEVLVEDLDDFIDDLECGNGVDAPPSGAGSIAVSGYDRCEIVLGDPDAGDGRLTYTVTARGFDKAGNVGTDEKTFFVEVTDPPTVEGDYLGGKNGTTWSNTDVSILWTGTPAQGWNLDPLLGALFPGGTWAIDGDGVGTFTTTATKEGDYQVTSPTACHRNGICAEPITKRVRIDRTSPRVDESIDYDGPLSGGGWYRDAVTVTWAVGDPLPAGPKENDVVSGVPSGSTPPSTVVSAEGITVVTTPDVSDRAGNVGTGHAEVKIDRNPPTITAIDGVVDDGIYHAADAPAVNDLTCQAVDEAPEDSPGVEVSGVNPAGCKVLQFGTSSLTDEMGPPGELVTWRAQVRDVATNQAERYVTTRVFDIEPVSRGRMTVGGHFEGGAHGRVRTSGTLRCNGSPNNLGVQWDGGAFTLEHIDVHWCWNQGDLEGTPAAPIDSLFGVGSGRLATGEEATIEWTFMDREVPRRGQDTARIVITTLDGTTMLDTGGTLTGGNYQAHDAQGDGTNDNGNVNGPTGSGTSSLSVPRVAAVLPEPVKLK